jgi:hypothetical protein
MRARSEADDWYSQEGREKPGEDRVMDGLLQRLAARHPGGRGGQGGRGLEHPPRTTQPGSRAAVLDAVERVRRRSPPVPGRYDGAGGTSRIRSELRV